MTPPPNAIRCLCGRGWLRLKPGTHGPPWCDHTARVVGACDIITHQRRRGERPLGRGDNATLHRSVALVRTWPYVTDEAPDEP